MDIEEMRTELRKLADEISARLDDEKADRQLIAKHALKELRVLHGPAPRVATVILFKLSGKYYTEEDWRIPGNVLDYSKARGTFMRGPVGPYDMRHSPDFRRIGGGAVLIPTQEPWGYPHLFPTDTSWSSSSVPGRTPA